MSSHSLAIGIVGLPNVGKSTLFNALTKKSVPADNYPFCTIDPSVGIVPVPDERLWKLSELSKSEKTIPAVIEFVDIAGLVEGASKGEGLGNKFLSNIREVDAVLQIVRIFEAEDENTAHVYGGIDPLRDIKVINMELILADLETVNSRLEKLQKDLKKGDKEAKQIATVAEKAKVVLEEEQMVNTLKLDREEEKILKTLNLLTAKKIIYGLNKRYDRENFDEQKPEAFKELVEFIENSGAGFVIIDALTEDEVKDLEEDEKLELIGELDGKHGLNALIKESYKILDLITFFTTGEKETRAWTAQEGSRAPEAGASIHSDFQDKFIRAQIIFWQDLLETGSMASAREKGLLRTEGKEYIVKDGDVIEFLI